MKWVLTVFLSLSLIAQAQVQETATPDAGHSSAPTAAQKNPPSQEKQDKFAVVVFTPQAAAALLFLAAGIGIITAEQKTHLLARINASVNQLSDDLIAELRDIMAKVEKHRAGEDSLAEGSDSQSRAQQCTGTPEQCCGDFFKRFDVKKKDGKWTWAFYKNPAQRKRLQCCFQWDDVHGGLEIFDKNGKHLGERGCEDMSDDPCAFTEARGEHAQPNSLNHRLRWGASCE
jgi:hypothetical protein